MKILFVLVLLFSLPAAGADIASKSKITCVSDESRLLGRKIETTNDESSNAVEKRIANWIMKETFGAKKSKIVLSWTPKSNGGPKISLQTTDRPHNLISIRSLTDSSLIFVTSTSNFYSAESWTMALNFHLETMMATRLLSNKNGIGSEQLVYNCQFD